MKRLGRRRNLENEEFFEADEDFGVRIWVSVVVDGGAGFGFDFFVGFLGGVERESERVFGLFCLLRKFLEKIKSFQTKIIMIYTKE